MNDIKKEAVLKLRQNLYYVIIFIVSLVVLVFMPMVGSEAGVGFDFPTTTAGWLLWATIKVLVALLNVIIFYSFMQQAKLNVRDNDKYKQACEILSRKTKSLDYKYKPMNPKKWEAKQYTSKGISIFISTGISLIALSNAFLTYDYFSLLTYGMTILLGIVFGILSMASAEDYWTREFYDYAIGLENKDKTVEEDKPITYQENENKLITEPILGSKGENNNGISN